jgi:hypothetical protein
MANTLKIKRGTAATIPQGQLAEPLFTTDTYDLYIGKGAGGNQRIQNYIASGTSSQFLKGDGTLDSTSYQPLITAGTTSQYYRGDKTFQILDTSVVPENGPIYFTEPRVRATVLTGLNLSGGGTIAATDSILTAFGKVQNQISALVGGATYQGTWNASTNTPTLASGTGTKGYYYVVSVAGSTNLDGITDWKIGDWAIFNGTTWDKVDNTDAVSSVNGFTGAVNLGLDNISDVSAASPTNAQFLRFNGTNSLWENYTLTSGDIPSGSNNYIQNNATATAQNAKFYIGTGNRIDNSTNTDGIYLANSGIGNGYRVANSSTGSGIVIDNSSGGTGLLVGNTSTGSGIVVDNSTAATGYLFRGAKNAVNKILMDDSGNITAASYIKSGGTSSQFLKADGSVDSNTYLTTSSASSTYLPLAGGTLTGALSGTSAEFSSTGKFGQGAGAVDTFITIGESRTANSPSYIDIIGDTTYNDYGVRLFRTLTGETGANVTSGLIHRGTGNFIIQATEAATLKLQTLSTDRLTIDGNGATIISKASSASAMLSLNATSGQYTQLYWNNAGTTYGSIYWDNTGSTFNYYTSGSHVFTGNVGIGSSPSAWSTFNVLELSNGVYVGSFTGGTTAGYFGVNNYFNGTDFIYKTSTLASRYQQSSGTHQFYTAPTGTAGNAITFTKQLEIANNGVSTFSSSVKVTGSATITGNGLEMYFSSNTGYFGAYDRGASVYRDILIYAKTYLYDVNGTERFNMNSSGIDVKSGTALRLFETTNTNFWAYYTYTDNSLRFNYNGAGNDEVVITSGGSVGIGTTSPYSLLQVTSGTAMTTSGGDQASNATIEGANVAIGGSFTSQLAVLSNSAIAADIGGGIAFGSKYSGNAFAYYAAIKTGKDDATSGNYGGYLQFATRANGGSLTERMRITSGGNVGIGTTNPNVYGNGFTNQFTVSTTSGYANITVAGSSGNSGGIDFGNQTVRHSGIYALDGSNLAFYTNGSNSGSGLTERMRITSGGEVLINTTTDSGAYYLQVNGSVYATAYYESSDIRLKDVLMNSYSENFSAIEFMWKDKRDDKKHWGYAAQDVIKYIPDAIEVNNDGMMTVNYNEAHTWKIAQLEAKIVELEAKLK